MFTRKYFPLKNEFSGLFNFFRQITDNINNTKIFSISAPDAYYRKTICADYTPSDVYSLVDGNQTTAFGNDNATIENAYFTINLKENSFQITGISFHTICCNPNVISISAGNSEDDINLIGNISDIDGVKKVLSFNFDSKHAYKIYKLSMPEQYNCNDSIKYRLQLSELEFYGILNPLNFKCTQQIKNMNHMNICYILVLIIK